MSSLLTLLRIPMSNFCKLGATFRPRHRERFRRLVRKLNYLTVTCPNIYFTVSLVSQFLKFPYKGHCYAVFYILKYIKDTPRKGLLHEDKGHTKNCGMQMQIGQILLLTCQIFAKLEGATFRPRNVQKGLDL